VEIVRRIFRDFAAGIGPRAIAKTLNDQGVAGPEGKLWSDTTIRGHVKRGTGIVNNELYIGRLTDALNRPEERLEAAEVIRTPDPNRGEIDAMLYGELGTILNWIERQAIGKAEKRNTPGALLTGVSVSVVAGAGLVLSLRQSHVENKAGLINCFNGLFSAHG
jgi:hypothetical protein